MNIVDDGVDTPNNHSKTNKYENSNAFLIDSNQNPEFFGNENQQS